MACNPGPRPKVFSSERGRFSVIVPAAMRGTVKSIETPLAGKVDLHLFLAQQGDTYYIVAYCDYPQEYIQKVDYDKLLDGARNGAVTDANGRIINETRIKMEGNPGREIVIEGTAENGQRMTWKARLILVRNRLYQIMAAAPKGRENIVEMNDYLKSFKIIP